MMIGTKKQVIGGVEFTADGTNEGFVFKDEQAFESRKGICYICESAFDDADDNGVLLLTPDNVNDLVEYGGVSTYNSICNDILRHISFYADEMELSEWTKKIYGDSPTQEIVLKWEFVRYIASALFYNSLEWAGVDTYLQEMDLVVEFECFCNEKLSKKNKSVEEITES